MAPLSTRSMGKSLTSCYNIIFRKEAEVVYIRVGTFIRSNTINTIFHSISCKFVCSCTLFVCLIQFISMFYDFWDNFVDKINCKFISLSDNFQSVIKWSGPVTAILQKFSQTLEYTVKPAYEVTSVKASPVFSSHIFWVPWTKILCK